MRRWLAIAAAIGIAAAMLFADPERSAEARFEAICGSMLRDAGEREVAEMAAGFPAWLAEKDIAPNQANVVPVCGEYIKGFRDQRRAPAASRP